MNIFEMFLNLEPVMQACIAVAIVLLIMGLIKKVLWMCVVPIIVFVAMFVLQPKFLEPAKEFVIEKTGGAVDKVDGNYEDFLEENK